uniref:Phosphoglucomutase/phosphomannomutase family protein n=1 Tax=candidate division CPR3 bacterium TaxID=2268181 RepID=A0A7V3J9I2_UNCC3
MNTKKPSDDINFKLTSDGWRGKLAQNFTFSNVKLITNALAKYLIKDLKKNKVVLGYDTRFMSKEFADFIADILCDLGLDVFIINRPSPTPLLTFATNKYKFPFGINVTASHNSPFENGLKIRMGYGGTPTQDTIKKIESYFGKNTIKPKKIGKIKSIDPFNKYFSEIGEFLNTKDLKKLNIKILVDTMHGATNGILKSIFRNIPITINYLNENFDPFFGGINPEPKFETTRELQHIVKVQKYNLGIAHDGDGDRIIAVYPSYGYLSPHDVSAILLWYLAKYQKAQGKVLGSSTLGRRVKRICNYLGLDYQEIPVGFKNSTEIMLKEEVLLAAEENGGLGFGFYLPERDATLAAVKLIEAEITVDGGIKKLLTEIENIAGKSGFCRVNYVPSINRENLFKKLLRLKGSNFNYRKIDNTSELDGIKVTYDNGDWLSIRFSGTEDVIRIYCESETRKDATRIKDSAIKQIQRLEG